jgi:hypothetical protein
VKKRIVTASVAILLITGGWFVRISKPSRDVHTDLGGCFDPHRPYHPMFNKFTRGQKGADKANDPVLVR